jgi:hypothetical protein
VHVDNGFALVEDAGEAMFRIERSVAQVRDWMKDVTGNFNAGIFMVAGFLVLGAIVISLIPMKHSAQSQA